MRMGVVVAVVVVGGGLEGEEEEARRWVRKRERERGREKETDREESSKALQRPGGNTTGEEADSSSVSLSRKLTHARARARATPASWKDMERHLQVVARGGELPHTYAHNACQTCIFTLGFLRFWRVSLLLQREPLWFSVPSVFAVTHKVIPSVYS